MMVDAGKVVYQSTVVVAISVVVPLGVASTYVVE